MAGVSLGGARSSSPALSNRDSSSSSDTDTLEVDASTIQMSGLLMKKPFGRKSSKQKWQKRFFIAKDGFLLYYAESEMKAFESKHHFNIHPKGVIPLGGCKVSETIDGPQKFAIKISHSHFQGELMVGAENNEDCKRWIEALTASGKVTWKNAQLGESVIQELELKSQQVAQEKQEAIDKLNAEASKLEQEKEQKAELERLAAQLEEEKKSIEEAARNLREEKTTAEQELKITMGAMSQIEEEKSKLSEKTMHLQANLEDISRKSKEAAAQLEERERLAKQLEEEKRTLEETTSHLKGDLLTLEERSKALEQEKLTTEEQLQKEAEAAEKLKNEMRQISDTAVNLQTNLQEAEQAKLLSMSELEKEKKRRIKTEHRLRLAEDSLKRLDKALKESGVHIDLQIETDVKNLRRFFEDCIAEEEFEAQKLDIMRDAIRAKAEYSNFSKSGDKLPKPQVSPPTLPKPANRRPIESESAVNGCVKSSVENGDVKITVSGEAMTTGCDEDMAGSQQIATEDSRDEGIATDQPVPMTNGCDMPQPLSQDTLATNVPTDEASNSTS